jgi:hypothetical protein
MTRNLILTLTTIFFIAAGLGMGHAEEPAGNKRKGKYTYRKVYESCSQRGEVESKTPPVSPSDKTMAQWQRIFEAKEFSEFKCADEWSKLSAEDLLDIYSYLYSAAADSPSPAKCK